MAQTRSMSPKVARGEDARKSNRIATPELSPEEEAIIEAYRRKYRQTRGQALLLAAIPVMKADLMESGDMPS